MKCPKCDSENIIIKETPNLVHWGKLTCVNCGRWIEWLQNPEIEGRKGTSHYKEKDVWEFHGMYPKNKICFFCGRTREQLGVKETFTVDHIKEIHETGEDILENLQILCTACHMLKNWMKVYVRKHLCEKNE